MLTRRSRRDESGAVAVVYGLLIVVLVSVAALGTDIGNKVGRLSVTQNQADFAALDAGQMMSDNFAAGATPSAATVNAVVASLNSNQPQDDKPPTSTCVQAKTCVGAAQLTDGDVENGEVRYTALGLQVIAPRHWVDFGFAKIMGFSGSYVDAAATVHVYSPGLRVMPMFAVTGCDYGLQTLADPSGGGATSVVPALAFPIEINNTDLQSPLVLQDSTGASVSTFPLSSTGNTLQVTAKKWDQSNYIGFFRSDDLTPSAIVTVAVPGAPFGTGGGSAQTVTVNVPASVTSVETVWWVRIFDGDGNPVATPHAASSPGSWSKQSDALPVVVGQAALQCLSGPTVGNFGTLKFPRTDVPNADFIPVDIAAGLQPPLTPHTLSPVPPSGLCTSTTTNAVISDVPNPGLMPGTNCVDTDTGLAANVATQGLIQGSNGHTGLLLTAPTKSNCDPNGGSTTRNIAIAGGPYKINDEVLSCYLTGGKSIGDIAKASYAGGPALDASILTSPRFFFVPVLKVQPSGGGNKYAIIDFRPAFITDEQAISSAVKNSHTGTSDNGIMIQGNDIKQLKVVFFNFDALPRDPGGNVIDYLGTGPKLVRLVH
jgi:Flp pilus assembly pilin Flp